MILLVVGFVFYMLSRGYDPNNFTNMQNRTKQKLQGSLSEHEAGLLVALMAKVAKADGKVCELEAQLLSNTFTDISRIFENPEEIREELKAIYKKEMQTFEDTIIVSKKYLNLTRRDYVKRLKVMEYLLNLCFIDHEFSNAEYMITEDIANALEVKKRDFEALIAKFKAFYAQASKQAGLDLNRAYEILGVNKDADFATIKKEYRKLVRQNHPDILMGQGKSGSIIDDATRKLQEINEAYELIKKNQVQ